MKNRKVYISGDLVPDNEAKISIYDSAVLLGDTVTESTRTFNYKPFKLIEQTRSGLVSMAYGTKYIKK